MSRRESPAQPDLFALAEAEATPGPGILGLIRQELRRMLAAAEATDRAPFPDITAATVAELRFNAMLASLPAEEAAELRAAHDAALDRYYASLPPSQPL
ncbi:MAG: hypothetical protein N2Z67_04375 [Acetobacteraceae bacterium]|nr:hypothetical protein [Acetobacteraceae bacterium]